MIPTCTVMTTGDVLRAVHGILRLSFPMLPYFTSIGSSRKAWQTDLYLEGDQVFKSNQCIRPKFEVDEENVPVEGSHSKVVDVQVLHQLPQVGVEDVGEERVEHVEADFPAEFLSPPQMFQNWKDNI